MHCELARGLSEDQPAAVRIHVVPAQHVAEERTVGLGVTAEDDRVNAFDHPARV